MGPIREMLARRRAAASASPLAWVRGCVLLGLLWVVLSWSGCGWLYPYVAPFVRAPLPPPVIRDAEEIPLHGTSQAAGYSAPLASADYGWAGEKAAAAARQLMGGAAPPLFGFSPDEWRAVEGRRVVLWPFIRVVAARGPPWPNIPQPVGDCVSRGWSHGAEFASAVDCYFTGAEWSRVYPPFVYGTSRVQVGGGGLGGDGSTGAWAAKAVETYGLLRWTDDLPRYEAGNIRSWGRSGPPAAMLQRAAAFKAKTKLVTDFDSACVAISHGWPIPVCSSQGFQEIVQKYDRVQGKPSGTWYHCMVFIGFDARPGVEALYCYNSWGENAHAPAAKYDELDKAPAGGFWVLKATAERMLNARDSYSISFDGFTRTQSEVYRGLTVEADREGEVLYSKP